MQLAEESLTSRPVRGGAINSADTEANLHEMRIGDLRHAVRKNQVSFPSQIPTFPKHDRPDLQRKLVQLYFFFGWSARRIALRYGLSRSRAQQILDCWRKRAVESGYVRSVTPVEILTPSPMKAPIVFVLWQVPCVSSRREFDSAVEKTLMGSIIKSDQPRAASFMPF